MKVILINKNEVSNFIESHGRMASVCYNTNPKYSKGVGKSVLASGHMSGSRGVYFSFEFSDVPRSLCDQAIRHDIGTFKNVQSFRYVNMEDFSYHTSLLIKGDEYANAIYKQTMDYIQDSYKTLIKHFDSKGISGEKVNQSVRGLLPMNTNTKFVMGFTAEALFNFMNKRLCNRAEEHIRQLANMMKNEVLDVLPEFKPYLVADCEKSLFCNEGKYCCGKFPTKSQVEEYLSDDIITKRILEIKRKDM